MKHLQYFKIFEENSNDIKDFFIEKIDQKLFSTIEDLSQDTQDNGYSIKILVSVKSKNDEGELDEFIIYDNVNGYSTKVSIDDAKSAYDKNDFYYTIIIDDKEDEETDTSSQMNDILEKIQKVYEINIKSEENYKKTEEKPGGSKTTFKKIRKIED